MRSGIVRIILVLVMIGILTACAMVSFSGFQSLRDRQRLIDQLIRHEDLRLKPYRCPAGRLTIGVGRNLDAHGISRAEAMLLLKNDIDRSVSEAHRIIPKFQSLDEVRQVVLIDMIFNLGATRFMRFRDLLAAITGADFAAAALAMEESRWCGQVGERCFRLSEMMYTGRW